MRCGGRFSRTRLPVHVGSYAKLVLYISISCWLPATWSFGFSTHAATHVELPYELYHVDVSFFVPSPTETSTSPKSCGAAALVGCCFRCRLLHIFHQKQKNKTPERKMVCTNANRGSNNQNMSRGVLAASIFLATVSGSAAFAPAARGSSPALHKSPTAAGSRQTAALFDGSVNRIQKNGNARAHGVALQMVPAGVGVAAITGAISGGLFAGGLHAVAGKLKEPNLRDRLPFETSRFLPELMYR